jgi:hypothetical protein
MVLRKRLIFFVSAYLFLAMIAFVAFVVPALYEQNNLRVWADSVHYMGLAREKMAGNNDFDISFFSIPTILAFLGNDLFAVLAFNTLVFVLAYVSICRCFYVDKEKFLFWILINPMFVFSWLTPSKEILGLSGVLMFSCFIKSNKYFYLISAGILCLFARGQLFFTLFVFLLLTNKFLFLNKRRAVTLIGYIFFLSFSYPFISENIFSEDTTLSLNYYFDQVTGSGIVITLYEFQSKGLYFLVLIPKLLITMFGSIPKIQDCFMIPLDYEGRVDVYSIWANIGYQICLLVLMISSFIRRKFRFDLSNDLNYYVCLNTIFFVITPFIQTRYIFPVYGIFVLQHALYTSDVVPSSNTALRSR